MDSSVILDDFREAGSNVRAFIEVAILQVKNALIESDEQVDSLSSVLVESAMAVDAIKKNAAFNELVQTNSEIGSGVAHCFDCITLAIEKAQFYDKLNQRLEHAIISLNTITTHVDIDQKIDSTRLLDEIISCYSLEEEHDIIRRLFKTVVGGSEKFFETDTTKNNNNNVELF